MIKPNYIEKLLVGVEVEWKALGDVTLPTSNIRWSDTKDTYRYIDLTSVSREKNTIVKTTEISAENAPSRARKLVIKNDVIFATTRPTQQRLCLITEEFSGEVASTGYCILRAKKDEVLPKWIYHCITSSEFKNYLEEKQSGSAYPAISDAKVKEFKIPLPPLKVQEEIVRILDAFTEFTVELVAELKAELKARKKQYTYYRDKLLTFDEGEVVSKALGDKGKFTRGKRFVKNDMLSEGFPCIHYGEMYTHYNIWAEKTKSFVSHDLASKLRVAEHGDVVIVAAGETIEDIGKGTAWLGNTGVVIHDACFSYRSTLNPKYVSYFLRTKHFHDQIRRHISSGKISAINAKGLSKAKIPISSLEEQARIVSILDKFDAITSSITEGLPREIELRQKQYEYYRNMLLSFPKEGVEE